MLLAAPWVTRAVTSADAWLIRGLLGPGRLAQRVHDLELSRALAVDDSAALLRRLERDLHDGAQIRLATLAMNLGMARGEARRRRRGSGRRGRPRAGRRRAPGRQGRARRAARPGPRDPPAGARQRAGRRPRLAGRRQRDPGRAGGRHPGPAHPRDRDHRVLLRRRAAGQRGQAQLREHGSPSGRPDSGTCCCSAWPTTARAAPTRPGAAACPGSRSGSPWWTAG